MAEREGDLKPTYIPDPACRVGCRATWGSGNQLFIHAGHGVPQAEGKSGEKGGVYIHELRWDTDMHHPITRMLASETHDIFMQVQKQATDNASVGTNNPQLVKYSLSYRSVIRACLQELQNSIGKTRDNEERITLQAYIQLFDMAELVWSLCEILFIDPQPGGAVLRRLLDWMGWHFLKTEKLASQIIRSDPVQDHPDYWNVIYGFVLQGQVHKALRMLSVHSAVHSDMFLSLQELLQKMPLYQSTGQSVGEFDVKWQHWQMECHQRLLAGEFVADNHLNTICRILCGEDQVFLDLRDICESWYCMLISRLFYQNPTIKAYDLQYHTQFCIDSYGGNTHLRPWDHILLAALEFDIHQVIKESSTNCGNWWFVAHLTDLLQTCGKLETQTLYFGSNLREFLLLEYATSLMSHQSLWQTAADYFDACPKYGRQYLEQFIEHIPLETDKKAEKVLQLCEKRDLVYQVASICKVMGRRAMHNGRLGLALSWALRSKDVSFVTYLAERLLTEYNDTGDFSNLDLIDNLGPAMLVSTKLTFLGKYREFHQLYKDGDFHAAAALLLSLLTAKMAPKRFGLTLLTDALPLLEAEEVIFSTQQTYDLLRCLEQLDHKDTKEELDRRKIELMRLGLARNLARAIVFEGSTRV